MQLCIDVIFIEFHWLRGFTPYRYLPSEKGQTGGFLEKKGSRNVHKKIERRERIRCYGRWWQKKKSGLLVRKVFSSFFFWGWVLWGGRICRVSVLSFVNMHFSPPIFSNFLKILFSDPPPFHNIYYKYYCRKHWLKKFEWWWV